MSKPDYRILGKHLLFVGDCVEWLAWIGNNALDAVVTDPPYGIGFMGKSWDQEVPGDAFARALFRSCKPGAHAALFGGPRTFHRLAVSLEDAGFEVRDCLSWLYGTGFPKSVNLGNGRGTALKPAWEPILVVRKPLEGTLRQNMEANGTGGLNIAACRIGDEIVSTYGRQPHHTTNRAIHDMWSGDVDRTPRSGRWPTNVAIDETIGRKLGETSKFFYCPKASTKEREEGLESFPMLSGGQLTDRKDDSKGLQSPRSGAGRNGGRRNNHPTVKPIALIEWLLRLLVPPGGIVADPFAGSGTVFLAGKEMDMTILGIEKNTHYANIAEQRFRGSNS